MTSRNIFPKLVCKNETIGRFETTREAIWEGMEIQIYSKCFILVLIIQAGWQRRMFCFSWSMACRCLAIKPPRSYQQINTKCSIWTRIDPRFVYMHSHWGEWEWEQVSWDNERSYAMLGTGTNSWNLRSKSNDKEDSGLVRNSCTPNVLGCGEGSHFRQTLYHREFCTIQLPMLIFNR